MYIMEENLIEKVFLKAAQYDAGDAKRIQHFTKVFEYSHLIGTREGLGGDNLMTLELAAILHDIGIHEAERRYGSCDGQLQEELGPAVARSLLAQFNLPDKTVGRVCYLIAHHHTYSNIDSIDLQILIEADFLVNMYEDSSSPAAVRHVYETIFKTASGRELCKIMFGL